MQRAEQILRHLSGPGAFRLFLASLVILAHTSRVNFGGTAVFVFFALSGYWICRIWSERYANCVQPYQTFVVSRLWRLLPVFLLASLVATLVDVALTDTLEKFLSEASHFTIARTAFSNFLILGYQSAEYLPLVPAWSLDIEIQFYLFAPVLVALLFRHPKIFTASGLLFCLLFASWVGGHLFVSYFVYFGAGMLCAAGQWRPGRIWLLGGALAAVCLILIVLADSNLRPILLTGGAQTLLQEKYNWLLNAVVALLLLPCAFATVHRKGAKLDGLYADLSYIVYLLHWPAVVLLTFYFGKLAPAERLPFVALTWASAFLSSYLVWRYFDRPIDRMRSAFVKRRLRPAQASAIAAEKIEVGSG